MRWIAAVSLRFTSERQLMGSVGSGPEGRPGRYQEQMGRQGPRVDRGEHPVLEPEVRRVCPVNIGPTFAELAGITAPGVEGLSMLPLLT